MSEPILITQDLRKSYGDFEAVKGISLQVARGEVFGLLGPNGAGKTTTISMLTALLEPTGGEITIDGLSIKAHAQEVKAKLGLVPQELTLGAFDKVINTLRFSRGLFGKKPDTAYLEELLKNLSLWDKRRTEIMKLSGGMKRRVLIGKALAHQPTVLFLDEPTAGVDISGEIRMYELIGELRAQLQCAVLLVSHDLHLVMSQTDQVLCLNQHLCCSGLPESVSRHPEYLALFGEQVSDSIAVYAHHHDHVHDVSGKADAHRHD